MAQRGSGQSLYRRSLLTHSGGRVGNASIQAGAGPVI